MSIWIFFNHLFTLLVSTLTFSQSWFFNDRKSFFLFMIVFIITTVSFLLCYNCCCGDAVGFRYVVVFNFLCFGSFDQVLLNILFMVLFDGIFLAFQGLETVLS